uniref:Granulin precursor n=1 Tax=Aquila chrysaetos chrysaetos TaxID=223781 RepID=A0A663FHL0_AQUCH
MGRAQPCSGVGEDSAVTPRGRPTPPSPLAPSVGSPLGSPGGGDTHPPTHPPTPPPRRVPAAWGAVRHPQVRGGEGCHTAWGKGSESDCGSGWRGGGGRRPRRGGGGGGDCAGGCRAALSTHGCCLGGCSHHPPRQRCWLPAPRGDVIGVLRAAVGVPDTTAAPPATRGCPPPRHPEVPPLSHPGGGGGGRVSQPTAERGSESRGVVPGQRPATPLPPPVSGETEARRCRGGGLLPTGAPSAMRTVLLLWLVLARACAWLRCPDGQPCPATPVSAQGRGGYGVGGCPHRSVTPSMRASVSPLSLPFWGGGFSPLAALPPPLLSPQGVPCAGGRHCCPRGSRCSADGKSCITSPAPRAVPCPDGQSECPDDATCCMTASGTWGCCPMPQASCCADKVHCCPHTTICDLAHGRCLSPTGDGDIPLGTAFPAWKRQPPVLCPDGRSACPDGATCCQLPSAQYGCCPLQNAVCCSDGQHCCPQGTVCDLERSTCTSEREGTPAVTVPLSPARDVKCDMETSCPDGNTCCQLSSGAWGCCPDEGVPIFPQKWGWRQAGTGDKGGQEQVGRGHGLSPGGPQAWSWGSLGGQAGLRTLFLPPPQAVCCPDHVHCCPQGYTCDPVAGSCLQEGGGRLPWVQKTPALAREKDVRCDEKTSCPDGNTCCQLSLGTWGCCPLEQAVCCPDHVHCCPQGYTCDPVAGSCLQGWGGPLALGDVRCDEKTSCPDGNTCCQLSSGAWGCCPLEEAVCCPDHVHCCPQGYTCDPVAGSCLQEGGGPLALGAEDPGPREGRAV